MRTLLLDPGSWDLVTTVSGDIAVAGDPYSQAQDAASAIKLFQGELYYDTTKGVPYWQTILGKLPPFSLMKAKFIAAALTVPGVAVARVFLSSFVGRTVGGQVQVADSAGKLTPASF
jgi:hypothetical protein